MLAIRLGKKNNRYINWIDEKWYETTDVKVFKFAENELEQIKQWLVSHFKYQATFIYENGKVINWNYFDKQTQEETKQILNTNGMKITFKL